MALEVPQGWPALTLDNCRRFASLIWKLWRRVKFRRQPKRIRTEAIISHWPPQCRHQLSAAHFQRFHWEYINQILKHIYFNLHHRVVTYFRAPSTYSWYLTLTVNNALRLSLKYIWNQRNSDKRRWGWIILAAESIYLTMPRVALVQQWVVTHCISQSSNHRKSSISSRFEAPLRQINIKASIIWWCIVKVGINIWFIVIYMKYIDDDSYA